MGAPATDPTPGGAGHALVVRDLSAGYRGVPVVRELNLEVRPGEVVALLGPNGAGKTTTLETIPGLRKCLGRKAGLLSGGEQQMLAVGRALVTRPRLLLVDEMSLGLAPVIVERLIPVLRRAADELGSSVLFVEQHVALALEVADRAYVLTHGRIGLEGPAAELRERRELLAASYLGGTAR